MIDVKNGLGHDAECLLRGDIVYVVGDYWEV